MTIRESIIHYQDKQNISSAEMSKALDMSPGNYSSFRNGRRYLTPEQFQKALDVLKLQITEL